ncbi:MAG TPA: hypothetical protein VM124_03020 [Candidatus Limnocylindrales bacterium]|nr:hypothetical protein [Candidatus Limnocylindrales bacterium]
MNPNRLPRPAIPLDTEAQPIAGQQLLGPNGAVIVDLAAQAEHEARQAREQELLQRVDSFNEAQEAAEADRRNQVRLNVLPLTPPRDSRILTVPDGEGGYAKGTPTHVSNGKIVSGWHEPDTRAEAPKASEYLQEHMPAIGDTLPLVKGGLLLARRRKRLGRVAAAAEKLAEDIDVEAASVKAAMEGSPMPPHLRPITKRQVRGARWAAEEKDEIIIDKMEEDRVRGIAGNWEGPDATSRRKVRRGTDGQPIRSASNKLVMENDLGTNAQEARLRAGRYTRKELKMERSLAGIVEGSQESVDERFHHLEEAQAGVGGHSQKTKELRAKVAQANRIAGRIKEADQRVAKRAQKKAAKRQSAPDDQGPRLR